MYIAVNLPTLCWELRYFIYCTNTLLAWVISVFVYSWSFPKLHEIWQNDTTSTKCHYINKMPQNLKNDTHLTK